MRLISLWFAAIIFTTPIQNSESMKNRLLNYLAIRWDEVVVAGTLDS